MIFRYRVFDFFRRSLWVFLSRDVRWFSAFKSWEGYSFESVEVVSELKSAILDSIDQCDRDLVNLFKEGAVSSGVERGNSLLPLDLVLGGDSNRRRDIEGCVDDLAVLVSQRLGLDLRVQYSGLLSNWWTDSDRRGSQLFHRDGDSLFPSIKVFVPLIVDCTESAYTEFISRDYLADDIAFISGTFHEDPWLNGRVDSEKIACFFPSIKTARVDYKSQFVYFWSNAIYHGGGAIEKPTHRRVVLQVVLGPRGGISSFNSKSKVFHLFLRLYRAIELRMSKRLLV